MLKSDINPNAVKNPAPAARPHNNLRRHPRPILRPHLTVQNRRLIPLRQLFVFGRLCRSGIIQYLDFSLVAYLQS